jgi:transposase
VELVERATRMALEARQDPASSRGAIRRIADQLGVHPEALRTWVRRAEVDGGVRAGTTTDDARRIAELERGVRELRRPNEILKTSAAFSPQRSSTARSSSSAGCCPRGAGRGGRRLHRCPPRPRRRGHEARSRADLRGPAGGRRADRSEYLLRGQDPAALGACDP